MARPSDRVCAMEKRAEARDSTNAPLLRGGQVQRQGLPAHGSGRWVRLSFQISVPVSIQLRAVRYRESTCPASLTCVKVNCVSSASVDDGLAGRDRSR